MPHSMPIEFPAAALPVAASADVVVCGGGPAGIAAAVSAARNGAKVVLLEKLSCAGGLTTAGLLPSIIHLTDGRNMLAGGICKTVVDRTASALDVKPEYDWQNLHPEVLKCIYDDLLTESGVELCYNVTLTGVKMAGRRIEAISVLTPAGPAAIRGAIMIDATGDGLLSVLAGAPSAYGDAAGAVMAPTLCTQFTNIDYSRVPGGRCWGLGRREWQLACEQGRAPLPESHFVGAFPSGTASALGNLGHLYGTDPLSVESLTAALVEGRRNARLYAEFYRKNLPGFEAMELSATGSILGIRETRRITGEYTLCEADYRAERHFDDDIGSFAYPIDIHASAGDAAQQENVEKQLEATRYKPGHNYGIPYRILLPRNTENLLVAGRCVSTDRAVLSSIRVVPGCMITGEAAGTAAAQALRTGQELRWIDIRLLQARLREQGTYIP